MRSRRLPSPASDAEDAPCVARRNLLAAGAGLLLAGCSNTGTLGLARQTFAMVGKGKGAEYPRTRQEIEALPYAQLGLARGEGPRAVLVLADATGEELSWVSSDHVQVVTQRNRVIRTTGLLSDLARTVLRGPDLWDLYQPARGEMGSAVAERRVRIEPGEHAPVQMISRFEVEGAERIEILGQAIDTLRVGETVDVPDWRWNVRNTWWLSRETRIAWRSVQHLTPDQPPLHLEMLKRPA